MSSDTSGPIGEGDPLRLRVMWDWHAFPVWGNTVIDDLPISAPLRARLQAWSDARTNTNGSMRAGWDDEGRRLAGQLQRELGPDVIVGYRNEKSGLDEWL